MRERPPSPLGGHEIYYAPDRETGRASSNPGLIGRLVGRLAGLNQEPYDYGVDLGITDSDRITEPVNGFMVDVIGSARYPEHIGRMEVLYRRIFSKVGLNEQQVSDLNVMKTAIVVHDLVDKGLVNPIDTVRKMSASMTARELKQRTLRLLFGDAFFGVRDVNGYVAAIQYAQGAEKWEADGRQWRPAATHEIQTYKDSNDPEQQEKGQILDAVINKAAMPQGVTREKVERVLKTDGRELIDLVLRNIRSTAEEENTASLVLKSIETMENIKNPPDDPGAVFRDCIEAITFLVPALMLHSMYSPEIKQLAAELSGAVYEWFYDDPNGYAKEQFELSEEYFEEITNMVDGALTDERFGKLAFTTSIGTHTISELTLVRDDRIKTEGSIRKKLATAEDYENATQVPDGVGMTRILPDGLRIDEVKDFAIKVGSMLATTFFGKVAKGHPAHGDSYIDVKYKGDDDGYEGVNITFFYYVNGKRVPFEIQLMTPSNYFLKNFGNRGDLIYKTAKAKKIGPEDMEHMQHLSKRARAEQILGPSTTIRSLAGIIELSNDCPPDVEIPLMFNRIYRVVDQINAHRLVVPIELQKFVSHISESFDLDTLEDEGLTVLPSAKITEADFKEALGMFGRNVANHDNIAKALDLIRESTAGKFREDGVTPVLDGHILPTAIYALMLSIQSGEIWDQEGVGVIEYITNVVTASLLHDYIEDEAPFEGDMEAMIEKRKYLRKKLEGMFGKTISNTVWALTSPTEIIDTHERRTKYSDRVRRNKLAKRIKRADRMQNHISDIVEYYTLLMESAAHPEDIALAQKAERKRQKTINYARNKTETFFKNLYTSSNNTHPLYERIQHVVWTMIDVIEDDPESLLHLSAT